MGGFHKEGTAATLQKKNVGGAGDPFEKPYYYRWAKYIVKQPEYIPSLKLRQPLKIEGTSYSSYVSFGEGVYIMPNWAIASNVQIDVL